MISFRQDTGLVKNGKINYKIHSEARMLYADLRGHHGKMELTSDWYMGNHKRKKK